VAILRWFGKNLGTLLMAFILSMVVWISAVIAADPNVENPLGRAVTIEVENLAPGLLIMNEIPTQVRLTFNAPNSRWRLLTGDLRSVRAWIDLDGLDAGEHRVEVEVQPAVSPVRVVDRDPAEIVVVLEPQVTRTDPINLIVEGEPALGYAAGSPTLNPDEVVVSGPAMLVARVQEIQAYLEIAGERQTIEASLLLRALDELGEEVQGVSLDPQAVSVTQPITLLGGYRNVIVRVDTQDTSPAPGYRLTNIVVTPPSVIVFSSDPALVEGLPGYIETQPLDLTGAEEDIETFLELQTPEGITVVNDQKVLVQVSISPIESNLRIAVPVEVIGLTPGDRVIISPDVVDVILSGPVPVLDALRPGDIRVVVDISGRPYDTYQLVATVSHLPNRLQIESILPSSVEVTITLAPTPTVTPESSEPAATQPSSP
jgi:YbbR domain-containing protein